MEIEGTNPSIATGRGGAWGLLALLLATPVVGCQSNSGWTGEWVGSRPLFAHQREDPAAVTLARIRLTIQPDGKFKLVEAGFDKEGTVTYADDTATLKVERMLGRPIEQLGEDVVSQAGTRTLRKGPDETLTFIRGGGFPDLVLKRPKAAEE